MSLTLLSALTFAITMLFLAGVHIYWALGGRWGTGASIPTVDGRAVLNATPLACNVVALLLVVAAAVICGRAGLFGTGAWSAYCGFGSWCLAAVFFVRAVGDFRLCGFFKTVRSTAFAFWDTRLYSPLCLVLSLLAARVALRPF
jgi:hypothetical protein